MIISKRKCNDFVLLVSGFAHKECGLDGVWFIHPSSNKTWSNYTTCVNLADLEVSALYCWHFVNRKQVQITVHTLHSTHIVKVKELSMEIYANAIYL